MMFYNVAEGDAPYLTQLAREYTMSDNFHQSIWVARAPITSCWAMAA